MLFDPLHSLQCFFLGFDLVLVYGLGILMASFTECWLCFVLFSTYQASFHQKVIYDISQPLGFLMLGTPWDIQVPIGPKRTRPRPDSGKRRAPLPRTVLDTCNLLWKRHSDDHQVGDLAQPSISRYFTCFVQQFSMHIKTNDYILERARFTMCRGWLAMHP